MLPPHFLTSTDHYQLAWAKYETTTISNPPDLTLSATHHDWGIRFQLLGYSTICEDFALLCTVLNLCFIW